MKFTTAITCAVTAASAATVLRGTDRSGRPADKLGRGVVAVRAGESDAFVSWRLLGLDPSGIGFNIYRSANGEDALKLNKDVLVHGTNYVDSDVDFDKDNIYYVTEVLSGKESPPSTEFILKAGNAIEPAVRIPIKSNGPLKFVWVGDLDGDGEYDFVLDRQNERQSLEAYRSNGEFLWEVNMGSNSINQDNVKPGSATINVGHWDGVAVHDFDLDGKAEVFLKIANGVKFGDGQKFGQGDNNNDQFFAILNGETGALRDYIRIKNNWPEDGPLAARVAVGYLDGKRPYAVASMKNRKTDGNFNMVINAWTFDGKALNQEWEWIRDHYNISDGHHTRIIDLDGDGADEVVEIAFTLNGDGTLRYSLKDEAIRHGDRFHIAKIDPSQKGLQGYGTQQNNPEQIWDYYYRASDGHILWKHFSDQGDNGRGMVADIDPSSPGMEVWSLYSGVWNAKDERLVEKKELQPWPHQAIWWDGDLLRELINNNVMEKWDAQNPTKSTGVPKLFRWSDYGAINPLEEKNPAFWGDIFGDWREEVIVTTKNYDELIIFTTDIPSDHRLYTLAHNPAYRNAMNEKGYMMTPHVDYFLGQNMEAPPTPNIYYVRT